MTFWILLVIAIGLTLISLKYQNILFSLGGTLGWIAMWIYNLSTPPTGIIVGTTIHDVLTYAFIIMAIAVVFMYARNRSRGYTGYAQTPKELQEEKESASSAVEHKGLLDMSTDEYKAAMRRRLHPNRRRR